MLGMERQLKDNLTDGDFSRFKAITAEQQHGDLSGKYSFIPTTRVIDVLGSMGWQPVQAAEMKCRNEARIGFQKHLLRFRNDALVIPGTDTLSPEIVLTNSHDGLASFNLMAGIFRLVCSNGLIIADSTFQAHRIRHMGYTDQAVKLAVESICDTVPKISEKVLDFQTIELTKDEQGIYAMAALQAKYGAEDTEKREFLPALLTMSRRTADQVPTLWNTFNSVQEKLIKGGRYEVKTPFESTPDYKRQVKARAVNSISENVRINQALWMLTEKMAELKSIAPASLNN